jgi:hypothetical protein
MRVTVEYASENLEYLCEEATYGELVEIITEEGKIVILALKDENQKLPRPTKTL